jgi:hypothetical protein
MVIPTTNAEGCSGAPSSNTRNPDTGAPLSEGQQFFVTNQSGGPNGTVLLVTAVYSTNPGGSVWSNNGAWGTVVVGGTLVMGASHTYYPPGCKTVTPVAVSTPTPSATDTRTATTQADTKTATTTTATKTTTTQSETRTAQVAEVVSISNSKERTVAAVELIKTFDSTEKEQALNVTYKSTKSTVIDVDLAVPGIPVVVTATKKGSPTITLKSTTDAEGDARIKTTKNLQGYSVTLTVNKTKIDTDVVKKQK